MFADCTHSAQPAPAQPKKDEGVQAAAKEESKGQEPVTQSVEKDVPIKAEAPHATANDQAIPTPATSASAQSPSTPKVATSTRLPVTPERASAAERVVPQAVPVSAARGPFPQLEMFSVPPRRHNTVHGTANLEARIPSRPPQTIPRPVARGENPFLATSIAQSRSQASDNITRRLADVSLIQCLFPCRY